MKYNFEKFRRTCFSLIMSDILVQMSLNYPFFSDNNKRFDCLNFEFNEFILFISVRKNHLLFFTLNLFRKQNSCLINQPNRIFSYLG